MTTENRLYKSGLNNEYPQALQQLKHNNQFRQIPQLTHQQNRVIVDDNKSLINLSSNDYLAIGADSELQHEFLAFIYNQPKEQRPRFGSTSSRLLTGNDPQLAQLEQELEAWYNASALLTGSVGLKKSALIFNSGYHANLGILPALTAVQYHHQTTKGHTLILADKLVHASIIDGMRLAQLNHKVHFKRYRHNDHTHLRRLIDEASQCSDSAKEGVVKRIIIVTESVFSMDGDVADLADLVAIKRAYHDALCVELYVDEAHSVGVYGQTGLGRCEVTQTLADIDYLVGTFGKAFASMGAYLICSQDIRNWLINSMRPFIYSTALPPMTHAWTRFVLHKMPDWADKRVYLQSISSQVKQAIEQKTGQNNPSQSAIIPYIIGDNDGAIKQAKALQASGFYALPIRPPTVPVNTARIRLVMNAGVSESVCQQLVDCL